MENIKIASCTGGFRNMSFDETVVALKNMGLTCVEGTTDGRAHLYSYIFEGKNKKELKEILNKNNVELVSVSGGWCDFAVADKHIERQYEFLRKQLDFCQEFNVKVLRIFVSHLPGQYLQEDIIKRIIKNLKRILPEAKEKNVYLALENHFGAAAKSEDILKIIEEVGYPNLKVTFDPANFLPMGEDPVSACKKLFNSIVNIHLKNVRFKGPKPDPENAYLTGRDVWRGYEYCNLGEGLLDYNKIFEILQKNNYKGLLSLEYENFSNPIEGTKKSYENLKKLWMK